MRTLWTGLVITIAPLAALAVPAQDAPPRFRMQEIQRDWGVVYAVQVADVNGDDRLDIVAINPTQLAWFENPGWQRHVILDGATPADNVFIAPADLDGYRRPEIALGAAWNPRNTTAGGTLHLAVRTTPDGRAPWTVQQIGEEPTLHRIRWADVEGDGRRELVVTPLHGRGTSPPDWEGPGARILIYRPPERLDGAWQSAAVDATRHILHNLLVADMDPAARGDEIVTASREGLTLFARGADGAWGQQLLGSGSPGEVALGRVGGARMLATVEPWHGTSLVVYREADSLPWPRTTVEDAIKGGHAIGWADFDGDGDDELAAGWRDGDVGLAIYDVGRDGSRIARHMIDAGGVAVEDLAIADLDADGRPDVVAGGRRTQNVRIYWNEGVQ